VERTIAAGSARVWSTMALEPPTHHASIAFEGVVDFARKRVRQALIGAEPDGIEAETIFADPTSILDALKRVETTERIIGTEDVRDVATTRSASILNASPRAHLRTDVWINGDGLIRRTATTRNLRRRVRWLHNASAGRGRRW